MNLLSIFQDMKSIYGFCPCCGDLFRLSEATLFTKTPPARTPFDECDDELAKLDSAVERFQEREAKIRQAQRLAGRRQARKRLKRIAPFVMAKKIDPHDVKLLFDPVEYIAFPGLTNDRPRAVAFVDRPASSRRQEVIHTSLERAIRIGNMEWRTLRIDETGRVSIEGD